ncbi:MAG: (Dimethylallyl)adenosine tRNA methylthiotransferase MiaB [Candidatus Moranbacteria bacterium GW2011_GWD2_36_12]|nr:MAG: (Dimethylallyl)adenosine tRNA methylthiotransferase MiaB [Candidatus Moranbacteria bacterium GW2011_GWD2_36_12]KKQ07065.1 MAG: (Dimethylallyl)adenosine tRNA methylthiotransferase MiaB [Candidatus Moranbacteria bacterium GW2011_GWE2_36_40]
MFHVALFSMNYFIKTFGCQMNVSDSERIAAFLEEHNFSSSDNIKEADLVIFNTCGIKQTAENRAYSMINNLRKEKKRNVQIIMTGCLANRADVQKRMKSKVDLFFPVKDIKEFENWIIENYLEIGNWKLEIAAPNKITNKENIAYLSINPKYSSNYAAYVPIMTGCNNFCAYCVVPNARGREVSRPAEEIISEIKDLIAKGYKSITLLGQNVNSYKSPTTINYQLSTKNAQKEINFATLLKKINSIPGKFWINFVSSHPKNMDDKLIETVVKSKKVCEWIHLPVQAGDDDILRKMNRRYTQKHYLEQIKKIRAAFKKYKPQHQFSISSDIIVGFPGETKKQFLESAAVMKKSKFDMVFFGQYSPRPETVAWKMKDNVSQKEKVWRENFLNEILKKTAFTNNKKYLNKTLEVLIEKEKGGFYFGKTRTQKNVKLQAKKKGLVGKFTKVLIKKAHAWNLEGEID